MSMGEYLAPGVYVEELPTNKPIEGASTSTPGFIGVTERGPVGAAQLVTSYPEYVRMFGGALPQGEFTDSGRSHCYLPHAIEGFFVNGGKRAYVTRVLPEEAAFASRDMFWVDLANATRGETVLLRSALVGSGTAVTPPQLYVLSAANLAVNDWVRIGDGSRAEYGAVAGISAAASHSALSFPLRFPHATADVAQEMSVASPATLDNLQLQDAALAGDIEITLAGADVANITTGTFLPGARPLFEIGATAAAEYVYAPETRAGSPATVRFASPLHRDYPAGTPVRGINLTLVSSAALTLPANAGESLLFGPTVAAGNVMRLGSGTPNEEVIRIGRLDELPLDEPAYAAYSAGTVGEHVAVAPLTYNVIALPTAQIMPLDSTVGVTTGMLFTHGADTAHVASVDHQIGIVELDAPLAGGVPAPGAVTVGPLNLNIVALPTNRIVPLDTVDGLDPGVSLTFGADTRVVSYVNEALNVVQLQTALPAAPAVPSTATAASASTTAAIAAGTTQLPLDSRLGLDTGSVVQIGVAPNEEYVTLAGVAGERGPAPDAGNVQLAHPLRGSYAIGTPVQRVAVTVDAARQPVALVLAAWAGQETLLVGNGTGYVNNDILRFTTANGTVYFHRLDGNAVTAAPREVELANALEFSHAAGQPLLERERLFEVRALDAGSWGNRLMVSCREETTPLVNNAIVLNASPPPMPGMFSSLQLATITGVEPGTILEMDAPDGTVVLPLLKVHGVDRTTRIVTIDAPGLQPAHLTAHANAIGAGENVRVRSREFSLMVMLRQRPDPTAPVRDENLLDQEVFRQLSMDPRHSRYIERIIGCTYSPGNADDDATPPNPVRKWDRRSEGASWYVRVLDLAGGAAREAIRIGPEMLIDTMPSGLQRPARHRLESGDDLVTSMGDAMYRGVDSTEPEHRTGLYTLKNLNTVSLVSIPGQISVALQQSIIDHCEEMRYRFAVLDGPPPPDDTLVDVQNQRQAFDSNYSAIYHPWLMIPDPFPASPSLTRQYAIPPSGHVLGIYARSDNERGVHKAPANEVVRGITGLTRYFTKGEQEILNPYPQNINLVRDFRAMNRGLRVWGARCSTSDPANKYVNVRRLLIFVEDSIDRGLQWVVFEPNAEELWARVRRSVTNFLTTVWRNGALEGTSVEQAFFVKCDRSTMTRDDLDNGRLIVLIGIAPVKPAEFVIARVALWTADATAA
jgi:uncharacterized protein